MSDPHSSQARIGRADSSYDTIGCGLLITPQHVLTCAHVVAEALGIDADAQDVPSANIPVDLPLLAHPFRTSGRVIRWLPVREAQDKEPEDIAVLELAAAIPSEAQPAPLLSLTPNDYTDLPVQCFGFPAGIDEGVRRIGTCHGENALGWVQLDVARGLVEGGFSGTGAWSPQHGAAVGLVVAARTAEQSAALIPVRTLFAAWPELDKIWRPRNPYKGLVAFGPEDRNDFFGRDHLIAQLVDRVVVERLVTCIGPSGSGKSSLIGAGLIPRLTGHGDWRCLTTRPGADPFDELAARLMPRKELTLAARTDERKRLGELLASLPQGSARVLEEYLVESPGYRLLLVVDQFEELFTNVLPAYPDKARLFVDTLTALRDSHLPVHLVIALRADFMGRAMESFAAAFVQPSCQFQVGPLEGEALRAAVEAPASGLGVRFAPGFVETILAELAHKPGQLPLLQFAMTRLWDEQRARRIDADSLRRVGGVRQALSAYADGIVDALTPTERIRARRILVQLVRPPVREDDVPTRQVVSFRRIPDQDQDLLTKLARSRLIVTSSGPNDEPRAEIAHEALTQEWERLKTWIAEDRAFRLWQEGLRSRLGDWEQHGKNAGFLLSGPPLTEAEGRLAATPENLSSDDKNYIVQSSKHARRHRMQARFAVMVTFLGLASVAAIALWQWQRASAAAEQANRASHLAEMRTSEALSNESNLLAVLARQETARGAPEKGVAYALSGLPKIFDPPDRPIIGETAGALVEAMMQRHNVTIVHDPVGEIDQAQFSRSGSRLLTRSKNGNVVVWNVSDGKALTTIPYPSGSITWADFSPDEERLVTASSDATAHVWDAASGKELLVLSGHQDGLSVAKFSPDGNRIFTASKDGTARLWNAKNGSLISVMQQNNDVSAAMFSLDGSRLVTLAGNYLIGLWDGLTGESRGLIRGEGLHFLTSVDLSPDGERIATTAYGDVARIRDWSDTRTLQTFAPANAVINNALFSPDGETIVTTAYERTARLWNAKSGEEIAVLRGHNDEILSAAFSPDGNRIVTGSRDGTAKIWDRSTGEEVTSLSGHRSAVRRVAFAPSGTEIVAVCEDGSAWVWDLHARGDISVLRGHGAPVMSAAFSPSGDRIVTGSYDGTARIWDRQTGRQEIVLRGHRGHVTSAVFSPDGLKVATASWDNDIRMWNAITGGSVGVFNFHHHIVSSVAFNSDGSQLLTSSYDHTAKIIDAEHGIEIAELKGHNNTVFSAQFSPDNSKAVTASMDRTVRVWNVGSGEQVAACLGHSDGVKAVSFSPSGMIIASGSHDGTVRLWEANTCKQIRVLNGHEGWVTAVAFSPDGSRLASASKDGTARIWDSLTGAPLMVLRGHKDALNSVAFDASGEMLITASEDRTARIWFVGQSLETLISEAWSANAADLDHYDVEASSARLELGKKRSAIYYVSENSGDLIVFYFRTQSALGRQITSGCEDGAACGFIGDVRWLEKPPEDDSFASEHASAAAEIVSINEVKRESQKQ